MKSSNKNDAKQVKPEEKKATGKIENKHDKDFTNDDKKKSPPKT